MAINKNFVIKNGVEVNTSLIVGDATLNKVGVGTTVPGYTLHVGGSRGGIGATDLTVTGIATVGTSGSTSAALSVVGVSSFQGDVNFLGSAGVSTITFDASLDKLNFADNARATFGASDDLQIFHDGSKSIIRETGTGNLVIEGTGETLAVFADDGAVSLYYDNANVFQTTPQGVNVSGVTTSNRLNISGVSTFTSIGSNLIPDGDGSRNIGAAGNEWQDLHIDGTANIDTLAADTAAIGDLTENRVVIAGSSGELEDDSNFTFDGAMLKVGTAATVAVNGNAAFAGIVTVGGDLKVTGDLEISEDLVLDTNLNLLGIASISNLDNTGAGIGSLSVTGVSTFSGDLIVGVSTLFADVSTGRVGVGTNSPATTFDVLGNSTFTGNVDIVSKDAGSAAAPEVKLYRNSASPADADYLGQIKFAGESDTGVERNYAKITGKISDASNGTEDGIIEIAHIKAGSQNISARFKSTELQLLNDTDFSVAGDSTFTGNVLVGTGITIQPHGGVSIAGITTIGGNLNVTGNSYFVGMVTFAGGTNGNITLGDSSGDNVVFNADVNSNVIPNTNNAYDLGSSSQQWKDIYVDGVGYIDTVSADGVGIATATIRDSAKLDVDGDARFSGKVAVKDGGNAGAGVTIFDNGNIVASGIITASTFVGSFSGTVTTATNVTVADESSDTTCFPLFATAATGDLAPKSGSNLTFNSSNGTLTATSFAGNLTGGTVSGTTGAFSGVVTLENNLDMQDDDKILLGTGDDLEIYHDGTNSYIDNNTASVYIRSNVDGDDGGNIYIQAKSGEDSIVCNDDGNVQLYYDNVNTFQTNANGIKVQGPTGGSAILYLNADQGSDDADKFRFIAEDDGPFKIQNDTSGSWETSLEINGNGNVELYYDNSKKFETTGAGVTVAGICSASGGFDIGIHSAGTSVATGPIKILNFVGTGNTFAYTAGTDTIDISIAGGGGGGGASESDTSVSSTSATSIYTTAHATNRSVSAIIQITQGTSYQVGRYLVIHDGTTATIIEESAVATGDMLGSFTADINGSNLRILVNMSSASSATVTILPTVVTV